MNFDKAKIRGEKSAQRLMAKAEECLDVANDLHWASGQQHKIADTKQDTAQEQHDNAVKIEDTADKLDTVSESLIVEAIAAKSEFTLDAERPRFQKVDIAQPKSGTVSKAIR